MQIKHGCAWLRIIFYDGQPGITADDGTAINFAVIVFMELCFGFGRKIIKIHETKNVIFPWNNNFFFISVTAIGMCNFWEAW